MGRIFVDNSFCISHSFHYLCKSVKNDVGKYGPLCVSVLLGVLAFLFWWLCCPQALSYHEQYQLFQMTGGYFLDAIRMPGGLADYVSEFLVQFYYVGWMGALVLALLYVALQRLTWRLMRRRRKEMPSSCVLLSLLPPILLLALMGDESVLLSYTVALLLSLLMAVIADGCWSDHWMSWPDVLVVPLCYWLIGPVAWTYVALRMVQGGRRSLWLPLPMLLAQYVASRYLVQSPLKMIWLGLNYERTPMQYHVLMLLIPIVVVTLVALAGCFGRMARLSRKLQNSVAVLNLLVICGACWWAVNTYDSEKYELIRQDYLVRHERWSELIKRADNYQVKDAFSSNCVNLALAKERRLADGMFDYYQSGEDALIMPMVRNLTSNIPTAEAFWHLGMVNSAFRYMFDLQESILNARKSGRFTKRIVECLIVNGQYQTAAKHLALLKNTIFYRKWALETEKLLYHDNQVDAHPLYGRLRQFRFKNDFLYNYAEIDKMLGQLFVNNPQNVMALDYFMGEMLLKGNVQGFLQYMSWVQQHGGYQFMPNGYQDAVRYIQSHGLEKNSAYGRYVRRMMNADEEG